ncbi:hypothetical protein BDQ17DRAFT_1431432 [Cyathus striatus]|nr:hypothetical protein BDQ17DRAFT_1431432 [Cyathus striatus]
MSIARFGAKLTLGGNGPTTTSTLNSSTETSPLISQRGATTRSLDTTFNGLFSSDDPKGEAVSIKTPSGPRRPPATPLESVQDDESDEHDHTHSGSDRWQPSLRLLNNGSVARDHLASERTYLAYVRTSLGIASAGVALTQFFKLSERTQSLAAPLGATAIGSSLLVLLIGTYRYFEVQATLPTGRYPASRIGISVIAFIVVSLIVATFAIVIRQHFT